MAPLNFFRGTQHTKIVSMSGREYMDVTLKKGCYGTDSGRGCGLYGRAPIIGSNTKTVTMEYTYVRPDEAARQLLYTPFSVCIHAARSQ